jgi:penicillin-binding protein 1A
VTPLQLASAYGVFANGGYLVAPMLISKVTDSKGQLIRQSQPVAPDDSMRTVDERNTYVMNTLLQEVTRSGTAAAAKRALGRGDIYGKTGTTNDSLDAWFAGYNPGLVAVVWMGYDTPRKLGQRATGGALALPIWIEFMAHALKGMPVREPVPPEGVILEGGDWRYQEFARGAGVTSLGLEDVIPAPPTTEERSGILDLFRR